MNEVFVEWPKQPQKNLKRFLLGGCINKIFSERLSFFRHLDQPAVFRKYLFLSIVISCVAVACCAQTVPLQFLQKGSWWPGLSVRSQENLSDPLSRQKIPYFESRPYSFLHLDPRYTRAIWGTCLVRQDNGRDISAIVDNTAKTLKCLHCCAA